MGKEAKGEITTYLDFGKVQANRRTAYEHHVGQEAYDFYMGARYVQDIISYRNGEIEKIYQIEDLRDQIRKYAALIACKDSSKKLTFYEVGSAAMGAIDGLEYLNKKYEELDIKNIKFLGVDNSKWMNAVAEYTHEKYDVKLWEDVKDAKTVETDLFFAKGVSLMYAFSDEESMCDVLKKSKISIFDYTFSKKDKIESYVGTGLKVYFLSLERCKEILEKEEGKILIMKPYIIKDYHNGPEKTTYDCVYGDKEIVEKYFKELEMKNGENFENYGNPKFIRGEA